VDKEQKVKQAFDAWQQRRTILQRHSQLLESALKLYAEGSGPMPAELMDEVHGLRRECDALFKEVLAAVADRDPGSSPR
jgi:hypothetical protein